MTSFDLSSTDPVMALGERVVAMVDGGYDGDQITERLKVSPEQALEALTAYASRVLLGPTPEPPSPDCQVRSDGWCHQHEVFHPAGLEGRSA